MGPRDLVKKFKIIPKKPNHMAFDDHIHVSSIVVVMCHLYILSKYSCVYLCAHTHNYTHTHVACALNKFKPMIAWSSRGVNTLTTKPHNVFEHGGAKLEFNMLNKKLFWNPHFNMFFFHQNLFKQKIGMILKFIEKKSKT